VRRRILPVFLVTVLVSWVSFSQATFDVKEHYTKYEYMIPMRDGVKLYTAVFMPKDTLRDYPIMFRRTPYSVGPYGADRYPTLLGPSILFDKEGFIFVHQDIRGKFMSEGEYLYMRPNVPVKKSNKDVDHSSDTYDTVEWLIKNLRHHNGRVGIWGISYPGYLAALGAVDAHPAVKAVSPQAPMGDTFIGDDFHHNGAFFLAHAFSWLAGTAPGQSNRDAATGRGRRRFDYGTPDGYRFFLELGALPNADARYFKGEVPDWNSFMQHGTYDEYWKAQNVPQHMKNIRPAMMIVAGWFDSEDPWGAINIHNAIEKKSPGASNRIVWGPWHHGGWARVDGDTLGEIRFGSKTSLWYRENVELPFFNYHLKNTGEMNLPNVWAFMTGQNEWQPYSSWPPPEAATKNLYLHPNGHLSFERPSSTAGSGYDEYTSDPMKPVPFTEEITTSMGHIFMVEDQRFASTRPDVLVYESDTLAEDVTIAGQITPHFFASTSGTDCDWIVKVIDVFPPDAPNPIPNPRRVRMGHFQMLVGSEVMRSKFRKSLENPEPMKPGEITEIEFIIPDKHHRFKKGHRIMVQIQSTRFPLIDRNPGKFLDIYRAKDSDYQKTVQRVYRSGPHSSYLKLPVVN